jgi:uncharacterized ferritin-like protein (DUF455 family)
MELRDWAIHILTGETLQEKLLTPQELTDHSPGPALIWKEPARSFDLRFQKHFRKNRLPPFHDHKDLEKRVICLHRFAGHELLAVEIMAYALLAFPEAPPHFRRGLAHTLKEEQEHVRLYAKRLAEMGCRLEDLPFYRHFWSFVPHLTTPLKYVSVMSLTFEMANLDFAPIYGHSFAKYGDLDSAKLMQQILKDEIGHVSFGCKWLQKWKDQKASDWETWLSNIPPRATPSRARGHTFFEENRRLAGIPDDWIKELSGSCP